MPDFLSTVRKSLLVLAISAAPLVAQTGLGVIKGTVQDSTKAPVANAVVTLRNTATGTERTGASSDSGDYYFGSLIVGPYHLEATAKGFAAWTADFQINAGQTVILDPTLEVGAVKATVEVSATAAAIVTEGSQLSDTKTAQEIHDLPLNGRQFTNLLNLTPGVEGGQNTQGAASPRSNGMMVGSTEMLLDGLSYVDRFGGGVSRVQPGLDTIQEFRIETAGSGAAFDRPATVELVTRSGSNQFHGAAFETMRNSFGGLTARSVQDGNSPAKLIRNEFGGYVSGPVVKNKAFFFYDQEALTQRQQVFSQTAVATPEIWAGNFASEVDNNGNKFTIYNPYTTTAGGGRAPFSGNIIPTSMLNPQIVSGFQGVSPLPSGPNASANPWIASNFQTFYPANTDTDTQTGRYDQTFSQNDNLSIRVTHSSLDFLQSGGRYGYPPLSVTNGPGTGAQSSNIWNNTVHYTHTFSPTLVNDLQLAAQISENGQGTGSDSTNWSGKLGLPNPFGALGWPTTYTDAYNMFYYGGWDSDNHKAQNQVQYEIDDNLTWTKGKHTFKFGFKGRKEYSNVEELQQAQGSEFFGSNWTGLYDPTAQGITPFTGSGLASLELGLPAYLSNQYNRGFFYFRQTEIAFFGEDTWKVSPKLTLSLGLRWGFWTPYNEKYNRLDNVNLNSLSPTSMEVTLPYNATLQSIGLPAPVISSWTARGLTAVTANATGFPGALTPGQYKNFSPHIGVAYQVNPKWVIRGGYGIFYWPMPLSQVLQSMRVDPPLNLRYQNNVDTNEGNNGLYSLISVPLVTDVVGTGGQATVSAGGVDQSAQSFLAMDPNHWADNMMQEWTVTMQHDIGFNTILSFSYTGNHGSNLQQNWDVNAPVSRYNYVNATGTTAPVLAYQTQLDPNWTMTGADGILRHNGYSNSNSFQVAVQKRFSNNLSFQAFYAYTHSLTTNDSGGYSFGGAGGINAVSTGGGSQGGGTSGSVPANSEILGDPNLTNSQRLRLLYTNSSQVPPQRITWTGIYNLPFGKGQKFLTDSGRAMNALVGGWQISFVGTWDGGFWMGKASSEYQFGNPALLVSNHMDLTYNGQNQKLWFAGDFDPTLATNVNVGALENLVPVDRNARAIHPVGSCFCNRVNQTLADGTVVSTSITDNVSWNARNYFLGPPAFNQDISLIKYFNITERVRLRMSGDFFNAFNHPTLNNPNPNTGLINLSSQPNNPRIIQVGARVEF